MGMSDFGWVANPGLLYYLIQREWPVNVEAKLHLEIAVMQTLWQKRPSPSGLPKPSTFVSHYRLHHRLHRPKPRHPPHPPHRPLPFACATLAEYACAWDSARKPASAPIAACKCQNLFLCLLSPASCRL
jgi:hypothetical protein